MARYREAKGKIIRRFGENIFGNPKFDKVLERRNYPPGQHGQTRRRRPSNYGMQLLEKQKIKHTYGLLERQFRKFYKKAEQMKGETGLNLVKLLERRLDNVVYRMGFAPTRNAARQLVNHKHFLVNNVATNIPSYIVEPGDEIRVRDRSRKLEIIHESLKQIKGDLDLPWLTLDKASLNGTFIQVPERDEISEKFREQLVVELYSK